MTNMKQFEAPDGSVEQSGSGDGVTMFAESSLGNLDNRSEQLQEKDKSIFKRSGSDKNDSDLDISMSAVSECDGEDAGHQVVTAEDPVNTQSDSASAGTGPATTDAINSKKRRLSGKELGISAPFGSAKRVKSGGGDAVQSKAAKYPLKDRSLLPAEIWHHIFTFTPPRTLGKLLQVNKLFNIYLNPSSSLHCHRPLPLTQSHGLVLQPDAIWQTSRRRYWSKMPTPLRNNTELDMWRLACGKRCHFCGKLAQDSSWSTSYKLNSSSGPEGIRVIWSFDVRACGACLVENSTKEINLLLSSVPSFLLPALPFVLITKEMQIISSVALENGLGPGNVQFTKIYFSKHVELLKEEFSTVKALGPGTAEEWLKGLEDRGKAHRLDAARWEKWELAGGVLQMQTLHHPGESIKESTRSSSSVSSISTSSSSGVPSRIQSTAESQACDNGPFSRLQLPAQALQQAHQPRLRTREEVLEMKTTRRKEIERRAMLLEPPLPLTVLVHIPSFQAALQIPLPFDDSAWDLLKPRLLAQRADAEQRELREHEIRVHSRTVQERSDERRNPEGPTRESKELMDKDWDDAQAPLRAQISMYADETIRDIWDDGHKVDKDNSPHFAVDVLLHVRKKFYAEMAKNFSAARAARQEPLRDPPEGPYTQKLTLENMKWLFDTKIKPHTEAYRKELFLCNGCDGNLKAYGFEGVIQHYAAKHTNALSLGSIVVHWRSEWPDVPPFHPDPLSRSSQLGPPSVGGTFVQAAGPLLQHGFAPPPSGPSSNQPPPYVTSGPPPGFGVPSYSHQYGVPGYQVQHGIHTLPGPYPPSQSLYGQLYPQQAPYSPAYIAPPKDGPDFQGLHQGGIPPMLPHYSHPSGSNIVGPSPATQYGHNYNVYQHNGQIGYPTLHVAPYGDKIRAQLEDLALNSREVWMATAGIKELPGNIRVYVVLHHLGKRYKSRFAESPPLTMFIDGLSNNKDMRPVRNVNGLMCKACHLGLGNRVQVEGERVTFSLPQLVNHFQHKHIETLQTMGAPLLDWTIDMVYVPDISSLPNLWAMAGMDNHKHALIGDAFPQTSIYRSYGNQDVSDHRENFYGEHQGESMIISDRGSGANENADLASGPPQYNHLNQHLVSEYVSHQPPTYRAEDNAAELVSHPSQMELVPSSAVYTASPYVLQSISRVVSGRTSPDVWHPPAGKARSRKATAKDRRAISSSKNRRGTAKGSINALAKGTTAAVDEEDEEDKLAAEEAQRQEDAIRAMWAADRLEAARLASASTASQAVQEPEKILDIRRPDAQNVSRTSNPRQVEAMQFNQLEESSHRSPSPTSISDGEDDLFAGLESHLNQQQEPTASQSWAPVHSTTATFKLPSGHEPPLAYERRVESHISNSGREPPHASQHGSLYHRSRSRSPVRRKYNNQSPSDYYRRHSPTPRDVLRRFTRESARIPRVAEPTYSTRPRSRSYEDSYDQAAPRHVYRDTTDEERSQVAAAPARYADHYVGELRARPTLAQDQVTEAYELVLVRDSQGEYYMRRPIRHEPEQVYARLDDVHPPWRDSSSHGVYEQERYQREPVYEGLPRLETVSGRQPVYYETSLVPVNRAGHSMYEDGARPDTSSYEEYDPRFPAAPVGNTGAAARYVRYQR